MKINIFDPNGRKFAMEIDPEVISSFLSLLTTTLSVLMTILQFLIQ